MRLIGETFRGRVSAAPAEQPVALRRAEGELLELTLDPGHHQRVRAREQEVLAAVDGVLREEHPVDPAPLEVGDQRRLLRVARLL